MEEVEEMQTHLASFIVDPKSYKKMKTIGKGAYGKVYLAMDPQTREAFAIKELLIEQLEGRQLKLFCREVQIMAKCDSPFILPFRGFTLTFPYSIITDYIPNGSLFEAIRHRPKAPTLTATQKTVIAMGIAHGMMKLHELNIIHRDLKSLNILIDEKLYPKICDFGIARFKADVNGPLLTQQIGTPHWMAPELYAGTVYDSKVDVYSYGIILWEMLTEEIPFKGRCPVQIMTAICQNHERPVIPADCPKDFSEFMQLCWAQTPEERPTFKTIFGLLRDHRVAFEGTDASAIDQCINDLELAEAAIRMRHGIDLPLFEPSQLPVVTALKPTKSDENNDIESMQISGISNIELERVLLSMREKVANNPEECDRISKQCIWKELPFGNSDVFTSLYGLVFDVLQACPRAVSAAQLTKMVEGNTSKVKSILTLVALASNGFEDNEESRSIVNLLIDNREILVTAKSAMLVLCMIDSILTKFNWFDVKMFERVVNQVFDVAVIKVIGVGYRFLLRHFDESLVPAAIGKHLNNKKCATDALQVFAKCVNVEITEVHLRGLFDMVRYSEAIDIILRAAEKRELALSIASQWPFWLTKSEIAEEDVIRIIYAVTSHEDLEISDVVQVKFCWFLSRCLSMPHFPCATICTIVKRMRKGAPLVSFCETSGFSKQFLAAASAREDKHSAAHFAQAMRSAKNA